MSYNIYGNIDDYSTSAQLQKLNNTMLSSLVNSNNISNAQTTALTSLNNINNNTLSTYTQLQNLSNTQTTSLTSLNNINNNTLSLSTQLQNLTLDNTIKACMYGTSEGGNLITALSASSEGHLEVSISEPRSAFGEIRTCQPAAVTQIDFIYGLNINSSTISYSGGGSVVSTNGLLVCGSGTSTGDYGRLSSRRFLKYRPGQGSLARYTCIFNTGVTNTQQIGGLGDDTDGYFFGYNGVNFGILYRSFGVDTWIYQANFTDDRLDGMDKSGMNINPTKGNVYQISMSYLGFGNIYFSVMNPTNGQWILCHQIKYANNYTNQLVRNPSFSLLWEARALNTVSNIQIKAASGALFIDGIIQNLGNKWAFDNIKNSISTLTNIFTIRNNATFNGINNKSLIKLQSLSVCSSGANGISTLLLIRNTALGGSPVYNDISTNISTASVDIAGTTITGGQTLYNITLNNSSNQVEKITELDIYIAPNETLSFACKSTNSTSFGVSCNWIEDI